MIFASVMAAALVVGTGLTSASASTEHPYPPALSAFSPNGVVPGHWHLVRRTGVVYLTSGLLAGCHSAGAGWQRPDGTWLMLFWAACGKQEINLLSATYAATRSRSPIALRNLSVLGTNVDLVGVGPDGQILRYWLQGNLRLTLVSICHHQALGACASLTAPAARYMAARLPGRPIETKATAVFPSSSGLFGALVMAWLVFVGVGRMGGRARLEKFQMVPDSKRLYPIDQAAKDLRKVSQRRWWGKLFVIIGVTLAIGVGGIARKLPAQAAGYGMVSLLLGGVGLVMLRRYRHPLLTHERYHPRRAVAEAFHIRRLLSAALTLLLGLLSLLIPLVVLAGWALAGLASAEQDLSSILAGLVIAAVIACYFIDRGAQRLRARNLQEAMKRDPNHSMLYLRNFGDDDQKIPTSRFNRRGAWQRCTGWLNPIGSARFEEVLTRALAHSGPIIAVGQPGGKLHNLFSAIAPTLGAAKTTLSQGDWQDQVRQLATDARAVVVSATPAQINPGFAWELNTLAKDIGHGRIILVFGTGTKAALRGRFSTFLKTVSTYPLFQELTSGWISDGTLIMVHVPSDGWGTWRGWGAVRRTAWTYTAAIGAAMAYAEKAWARPPARLIPPPEGVPAWKGIPLREGAPTGQQETRDRLTGPQLTALPPTETMLAETVERALHTAAGEARRRAQPIDTKTLLVALMDADQAGRWDRICLNSRSREAIKQADYSDPPLPPRQWNNMTLTRACAGAFETARRLSLQYRQTTLQLGILVLGLIADESSAASRALNIYDQGRQTMMAKLVQEDLIGTNLIGLHLGSASWRSSRTIARSGVPRGIGQNVAAAGRRSPRTIEKAPGADLHLPAEGQERMGVAMRMLHTIKAKTDKSRDTAEDPRETLDSSYQRQLELLTQIRRSIADVSAAREHLESQMSALRGEQEELDGQTVKVSGTGTNRQGRHRLQSKAAPETELSDMAAHHYALQADEKRLMAASRRIEAKVESFRVQKEAIKAVYTAAEAEQKIGEALSSIYKEMDKAGTPAISPQRQLEALAQVRGGVAEVATSREHLEALASSLRQQQAELAGNARQALGAGREDLAREALAQRAAIDGHLSDLASQINSIQADEARLVTAYERLAAKIEVF